MADIHEVSVERGFDQAQEADYLCYCEDLSLNGTYHNGRKIGKNRIVLLSNGDKLDIRHCASFIFQQEHALTDIFKRIDCDKEVFQDKYEITPRLLGLGGFSEVKGMHNCVENKLNVFKIYMAVEKSTGKQVACKIISKVSTKFNGSKYLHEAQILKNLSHPNVIRVFHEVETERNLYIKIPLVLSMAKSHYFRIHGGDLYGLCVKYGQLKETDCMFIVLQMLKAIQYLHSQNVIHRDLKPENILIIGTSISGGFRIVLTDFGVAQQLGAFSRMKTFVGTPSYLAPEIHSCAVQNDNCENIKGYGKEIDLWSLGVIMYALLGGYNPFDNGEATEKEIMRKVQRGEFDFSGESWLHVSIEAKDFISGLLRKKPADRFTVDDALNHIWISRHRAILEKVYSEKVLATWDGKPSCASDRKVQYTACRSFNRAQRTRNEHRFQCCSEGKRCPRKGQAETHAAAKAQKKSPPREPPCIQPSQAGLPLEVKQVFPLALAQHRLSVLATPRCLRSALLRI
ncbi:hypothetical protein PMAC_001609 [Pneumocystis sp. 'macacae']|nr:hypothetical protein PMAC_001609 [Pneumocystis sp. 'macacae']